MELTEKVYVFSKQRHHLEQNIANFINTLTDIQKMVENVHFIVLLKKSKRLLVQISQSEKRVLADNKITLRGISKESFLLCNLERQYHTYCSEFNELLQLLLSYKKPGTF